MIGDLADAQSTLEKYFSRIAAVDTMAEQLRALLCASEHALTTHAATLNAKTTPL